VLPSPSRHDDAGRLRVGAHPVTFAGVTDAAFNRIRQYPRGNAAVTIRLLEAIEGVVAHASREEDQAALLQPARIIQRGSQKAILEGREALKRGTEPWSRHWSSGERGQYRCGCRWCLSSALQLLSPGRPAIAPV
jgi:hypothetical protein